jgi:hypothetical protein
MSSPTWDTSRRVNSCVSVRCVGSGSACPWRRAGRAYRNICQPEFELTGWVVGPTTTFHGDLRETREMLLLMLPAPPQSASSRPRAERATQRARRASLSDAPPRASCGSPLHQASKAAAPECVQAPPPQGCIAPRQSPHARLPHERNQCVPPRDAKGRRPRTRRQLPYRVSSGEELYNEDRPHGPIGNKPPVSLTTPVGAASRRRDRGHSSPEAHFHFDDRLEPRNQPPVMKNFMSDVPLVI